MSTAADLSSSVRLANETRKLGKSAILYLGSSVLTRALTLLLTPFYTRALAPADFAVVAVANALTAALGICFGLALHGSIPRLFFEYDEERQRAFFGTLLTISLVVPLGLTAALYPLGLLGYLDFFQNVQFKPHIELILWTSVCSVFLPLPTMVYMAREQPQRVAMLNLFAALSQIVLTILFVVFLGQGAVGVLRANLSSAAMTGAVSALLMARLSTFSLALPGARAALAYSLPLVPHLIGNWGLSISDRLILDKYAPAAEVGRYSLGYIFCLILGVVAGSIGQALTPIANRHLKDEEMAKSLPPLGTYALLAIVAAALGLALTAREVLAIIAPSSYEGAAAVVPWVVLGGAFQGVYLIWSIGTWFSMKTRLVPVVTLIGAGLNTTANLVFVPRHGIMAAAVATAASYAIAAALHGALAQKLHPIAWEYRRWVFMMVVAGAWYAVGRAIPASGLVVPFMAKSAIVFLAFPASLVVLRFFSPAELGRARRIFERRASA